MTSLLRVIATGYQGKEPFEYTTDVLRLIVRTTGAEYGFESCLTSRPFTARTLVAGPPGVIVPGRGRLLGADRAARDMADGLASLAGAGFRVTEFDPAVHRPEPDDLRPVVVGPLPTAARWTPPADRLVAGGAWRHVVVDAWEADDAICLDPVLGGYTSLPLRDLAGPGVTARVVEPPPAPVDVTALARRCLAQGAGWRTEESDGSRDGRGLTALAADVRGIVSGGAPRRMRLSLANYALHAMRSGALLGACGPPSTGLLALADLLHDVVTDCGAAQRALTDNDGVAAAMRRLADTAAAVDDLYRREADPR